MDKPAIHLQISELLESLLDKGVEVSPAPKFDPSPSKPSVIAVYENAEAEPAALLICNNAVAVYLGAALAMIPAAAAMQETKKNTLSESTLENVREVFNVCSQVMTAFHQSRVRLSDVQSGLVALPADLRTKFGPASKRFDLSIDIAGFGKGNLSLRFA